MGANHVPRVRYFARVIARLRCNLNIPVHSWWLALLDTCRPMSSGCFAALWMLYGPIQGILTRETPQLYITLALKMFCYCFSLPHRICVSGCEAEEREQMCLAGLTLKPLIKKTSGPDVVPHSKGVTYYRDSIFVMVCQALLISISSKSRHRESLIHTHKYIQCCQPCVSDP